MLKHIIFLLSALCLPSLLWSQYCEPSGTNTTGVEVDYIIVEGQTYTPTNNNYFEEFTTPATTDDAEVIIKLKATDNGVGDPDSVKWVVYIDMDEDFSFSSGEKFFESNLVPATTIVGAVLDISEASLPPGFSRYMRVVMSQDPAHLDGCNPPPGGGGFSSRQIEFRGGGGRRVTASSTGPGKKRDVEINPFIDCMPLNGTLEFRIWGDDFGSVDNININALYLDLYDETDYDFSGTPVRNTVDLSLGGVINVTEIYDKDGNVLVVNPAYPFDLGAGEYALISINYASQFTISSDRLVWVSMDLSFDHSGYTETAIDQNFKLSAGCCDNTTVDYRQHHSEEANGWTLLPPFTGASGLFTAGAEATNPNSGVIVAANTAVIFRSEEKIILEPGFLAKKDGKFLAYIENCNSFGSLVEDTENDEAAEERSARTEQGEDEIIEGTLSAYPNPFYKNLNIRIGLSTEKVAEIHIYDAYGRLLVKTQPEHLIAGTHEINLPTGQLIPGIYSIALIEDGNPTRKIRVVKVD